MLHFSVRSSGRVFSGILALILLVGSSIDAASTPRPARQFERGSVRQLDDLPPGRLRSRLEQLPGPARQRGLEWLEKFHFTEYDLEALQVDDEGAVFYADAFTPETTPEEELGDPVVAEASVPVNPFPASLIFHSKPGAQNVLFLNFAGEEVTGTAWNSSLGRSTVVAVPFSKDSDYSTYSDTEQLTIRKVWQRIAEDYAPFDIDVTTERPATFNSRTAQALITRNTDENGDPNPSSTAGGVAYVNVFGGGNYGYYSPGWIYNNNLSSSESYIAEAASHEIGHNMGLSHDGKTDGSSYYGGHGSGDTSWGPIMGTGYNRNVSQWSQGEYYLANNTQDDLATIAGKLSYRPDDHGDSIGGATPLAIESDGSILSTNPEDDPENLSPANKGILERNTDVDVFSLVTGDGVVELHVDPWRSPSGTRGGDLDVLLELLDSTGTVIATDNGASVTYAQIQTSLSEGQYYLRIRNTGTGNPMNQIPSGYTSYGSVGQYFVSGSIVSSAYAPAPLAGLAVTDLTAPGQSSLQFTVTYSDNLGIEVATLDDNDLVINGPNGYSEPAHFISVDVASNGTPRIATYEARPAAGGNWTSQQNGSYSILIQSNEVSDVEGAWVEPAVLGQFSVNVPESLYFANMDVNPGWTLEPLWEYGPPAYAGGSTPSGGFTGTRIVGYNLSGDYENSLPYRYATTPVINCSGHVSLILRFQQWLRVGNGDTVKIQVSTNGSQWTDVWSNIGTVADAAWSEKQYSLPAWVDRSATLQLRWTITSGPSQSDNGWNLDDVELLGTAEPPTNSPVNLIVSVNNTNWGGVTPAGGSFSSGSSVEILATAEPYFYFEEWTGDVASTNNPLVLTLDGDVSLEALFQEMMTTNHATPYWWLAANGFTGDLEATVQQQGSNGIPVWQSYIAGLDPNDPDSQLMLHTDTSPNGLFVLSWDPVPGRVYTVLSSTNSSGIFLPITGAANLPDSIQSFTNTASPDVPTEFYRLKVQME